MNEPVAADPQTTAPDIKPVSPLTAPPRTRTNETIEMPGRRKTGAVPQLQDPATRRASRAVPTEGVVPQPPAAARKSKVVSSVTDQETDPKLGPVPAAPVARRASRLAQVTALSDAQVAVPTAELQPITSTARVPPEPSSSTWTIQKVAGIALGVALVFILTWVFWPSGAKPTPAVTPTPREAPELTGSAPVARNPTPKPASPAAPVTARPKPPGFAIDIRQNVIDPYAVHLEDIPLDPAHRYRLRLERDDGRLGVALARLDEKEGWGSLRRMASHAALQFGGVKSLRMHCEPGSAFADDAVIPLELVDLATKKSIPVPLKPSQHCWDFEVGRILELGEGVKKRVRVPTDAKLKLGEGVTLKVAWVLESLGEHKTWRTGVLSPGESLLAEGRLVRFALLDPYANDNEGTLELELLAGDTESSGIVTPSTASGAQFVPIK